MEDVKVSVCMVTFNHDRLIRQSVESVLAQRTNFSFEIVIGEDCSTDDTRSILLTLARQHPETIRLRLADRNEGAKANFMGAYAACRGQYVAMLEGDDHWICPNKLQLQADALDAHPDWAICFHPAQCIYEDGIEGPAFHPESWEKPVATLLDLLAVNFIPTNAVMFRNRLFGAFPPWFAKLTLGDWPLHILNAEHGNIGFLPGVMSAYLVHARGLWSGQSLRQKLIAVFEMLTAIDHHLRGNHALAVDQFRLNTVHYLISELDASKGRQQELATRHVNELRIAEESAAAEMNRWRTLQQQLLALEANYCYLKRDLIDEINKAKFLQQEIVASNDNYRCLMQENRALKEFYDAWSQSIAYRVERDVRRSLKQFRNYMRRITRRPDPPQPPAAHPASKAA